jgi:drug/metabolite transporter (DMT)-like permease
MLSLKDPLQVVIIKGFGSGLSSLLISFIIKQTSNDIGYIIATLLLGFVAYGFSVYLYVYAQRELGAAKTSAYYGISPFIGVALSFIIFFEIPTISFVIALLIMIVGTYFASA